ncbi:MAG: ATP-binding cassette domain-containing protein [Verrucomicrobia bacterium]|jgi:lipopolysaccharide transport system ATP-binding protein|nr:ATP-binding cassette domain-containing protein [Verrucomicrobiota bacterium]
MHQSASNELSSGLKTNRAGNLPVNKTTIAKAESEKTDNEILVQVDNVSKIFCRDLKRSLFYGLRDGLADLLLPLQRKRNTEGELILRKDEFWANRSIRFELRRGECLGLIGHNGAGKTTLLKMLNGLIKPDTGSIEMHGRVGALIALNAGFNPILTGRENTYIVGSVYGMSKAEIDRKYDAIVEFAELEDFMDTPVQNYSSGMRVRLGFAVATAIKPDILIVDEVLAVGDFRFRNKCFRTLAEMASSCAVIIVSHQLEAISRTCGRVILLDQGRMLCSGTPMEVFPEYFRTQDKTGGSGTLFLNPPVSDLNVSTTTSELRAGSTFVMKVSLVLDGEFSPHGVQIAFTDVGGDPRAQSFVAFPKVTWQAGEISFQVQVDSLDLKPGEYLVNFNLFDSASSVLAYQLSALRVRVEQSLPILLAADYQPKSRILLERPK